MKTLLVSLALVTASAGTAAADGWIDCNGPDKHGRGCNTSGAGGGDTAATLAGLGLVTCVAFGVGRPRRPRWRR